MIYQRNKEIKKAFDKRDPDPSKNYGIHGSEIILSLKGDEGAITWSLFTARHLPHVNKELIQKYRLCIQEDIVIKLLDYSGDFENGKEIDQIIEYEKFLQESGLEEYPISYIFKPTGADLGYHSPKPMYDGHNPCRAILKNMKFDKDSGDFIPGIYGDPLICSYLDNDVPCYYDGSCLAGKDMYEKLIRNGEEEVWIEMEAYYESTFKKDL